MRSQPNPLTRCTACGYDLTGNISGRCPECGQVTPAELRRQRMMDLAPIAEAIDQLAGTTPDETSLQSEGVAEPSDSVSDSEL